jgi:hypothetical protein
MNGTTCTLETLHARISDQSMIKSSFFRNRKLATQALATRKGPSRMSKIKETLNATRADMRAPHIPAPCQPPPPPKAGGAPGEVEKTSTMRLRAKQSFRSYSPRRTYLEMYLKSLQWPSMSVYSFLMIWRRL